jgi:hypothetical protein
MSPVTDCTSNILAMLANTGARKSSMHVVSPSNLIHVPAKGRTMIICRTSYLTHVVIERFVVCPVDLHGSRTVQ